MGGEFGELSSLPGRWGTGSEKGKESYGRRGKDMEREDIPFKRKETTSGFLGNGKKKTPHNQNKTNKPTQRRKKNPPPPETQKKRVTVEKQRKAGLLGVRRGGVG